MISVKQCEICNGPTEVIDTRVHNLGYMKRRRRCLKCGHTCSTVEIQLSDWEKMIDKVTGLENIMRQIKRWMPK